MYEITTKGEFHMSEQRADKIAETNAAPEAKPTSCDSPDRIRAGEGPFQPLARVYTDVPFPQLVLEARQVRENYGGTFKVCQSVLPYVEMTQPTSSGKPETDLPPGSAPAASVGDAARNMSHNAAIGVAKAAAAAAESTVNKTPPKKK
jgi:hypothetical protein